MRKKYLALSIALALAVLIAGCGGGANQSASVGSSKPYPELRWGFTTFPGAIDWSKNQWFPVAAIQHLAVQNLVEFEPSGAVKPGIASSIEQPNSTTYIYHIRSGLKFSDGTPLQLADVVYSLDRNLYGRESIIKPYWEDVSSIAPHGSSAVMIKLKRPDAAWPYTMAFTSQVIEKAAAEKDGEQALGTPGHPLIGTGPWKIDSYKPEVGVRLSRNPYWTGPRQPAERIDINFFKEEAPLSLALRAGSIDGSFFYIKPKLFAGIPGTKPLSAPGNLIAYLGMSTITPPFNNVHVRRAVAYATDIKGMISALYPNGLADSDATLAPNSMFADLGSPSEVNKVLQSLPKYAFNLAAAKRELAKSPYPHGFSTTIQAQVSEPGMVLLVQILASDLAKIGISAKVEEIPNDEIAARYEKERFTIFATEDAGYYADPEGLFAFVLSPTQLNNYASYKNPTITKLLGQQSEALNRSTRLHLIGKMLKIVGEEVPYIGVFSHQFFGTLANGYVFSRFSQWAALFTPWAMEVKKAA